MTATQSCLDFYQIDSTGLSKFELMATEGMLFNEICREILSLIETYYQPYFRLIHFYPDKENPMIQGQLIQFIIKDIIDTNEYTLAGIAYYTHTPLELLYEHAAGTNSNPSLALSQKLLALHRSLKPAFYKQLLNKVAESLTLQESVIA